MTSPKKMKNDHNGFRALLSNREKIPEMYLVTGGCGFIGSHLVDLLLEKGYQVRVIDDLSNGSKKNLSPRAEFIYGSITDEKVMREALLNVSGVFHLAAKVSVTESIIHRHQTHVVNCGGTVLLFELAKGIPIVLASTAAVYGNSPHLPHAEEIRPLSPYAVDKLSCEMHAKIAWHLDQTPSISCRFFNVYGPRQNPLSPYSGVISKFTYEILRNEPITIFEDGQQYRDFIYVKDVAKMLIQAMQKNTAGAHVYNFCTGNACTINQLAELIGKTTKRDIHKHYQPSRPGDIRFSCGDPTKALQELGIQAATSLEEGLINFLAEV